MNLFIGNLSPEVTEAQLRELFAEFGVVLSVKIPIDHETGLPRGFGFVEMEDKFHSFDAIDNLDATYLSGTIISVKESKPKNQGGGGNRGGGFNRGGGGFNRDRQGGGGGGYNRDRQGGGGGGYNRDRQGGGGGYNRDGQSGGGYNRDRQSGSGGGGYRGGDRDYNTNRNNGGSGNSNSNNSNYNNPNSFNSGNNDNYNS